MLCMLVSDVFDPKIVHGKRELDLSPVMLLKTGNESDLSVAAFVEPLFKQFVG